MQGIFCEAFDILDSQHYKRLPSRDLHPAEPNQRSEWSHLQVLMHRRAAPISAVCAADAEDLQWFTEPVRQRNAALS